MDALALMIASSVNAGTVLALAALGLLINERAGIVNLGAEGMMLMGALAAHATAARGHGAPLAFAAGAAGAAAAAALFGACVVWLGTNQYATGLALSLFGGGFTAFAGSGYVDRQIPEAAASGIPHLASLRFVGPVLFGHHPIVYLTVALAAGLGWFFFRSRGGLIVRAVGESPESAHALGHRVRLVRFGAVLAGGALAGLAGAYISLVYAHLWVEGLVAGKGWIALALTTFATWRPGRVLLGAYLFGGITMLQFHLQGRGVEVESHLLNMSPYLATILVLVLIARNRSWVRANMPASLGKPFQPQS
jgi:simple sugar transport system permease protein